MQFSLDHKLRSHKQNQSSASDSVSLIFTRLHRSKLLSTTPITTLSLVKTSLAFLDAPPPAKVKFCFMTLIKVHWHNSIQNPKQLLFLMSPQIRAVFNRVP